jgi:hypothetical protein
MYSAVHLADTAELNWHPVITVLSVLPTSRTSE